MADLPGGNAGKGFWPDWLTPRRMWEFARNIATLESAVSTLQEDYRRLRREIAEMQKSMTEHEAQLRLLTSFVKDSLSNRLEAKIEKLAADILAGKGRG